MSLNSKNLESIGGRLMKMFEYTKKVNITELDPDRQKFMAKVIVRDVQKIAREKNISEEKAYDLYVNGLFGGDREIN